MQQQNFVIYQKGKTWIVETPEGHAIDKSYHTSRTKAFNELVKRTRGATAFVVSAQTPDKGE